MNPQPAARNRYDIWVLIEWSKGCMFHCGFEQGFEETVASITKRIAHDGKCCQFARITGELDTSKSRHEMLAEIHNQQKSEYTC
jgi:hypothetical protein